jgi:hypothetical protein
MDTLHAGMAAAREGRQAEARALLQQALQADPRSEQGWLWMSAVVESDAERRVCLERVLTINPYNQTARAALEKIESGADLQTGLESLLPVSRSPQVGRPEASPLTLSGTAPYSPHSMPTLGLDPVMPRPRPIERLASQPADGLAQLRAAQFQPPEPPVPSSSERDPVMALVLIGGLSITAVAGAVMLGVLLLIGWPP